MAGAHQPQANWAQTGGMPGRRDVAALAIIFIDRPEYHPAPVKSN
jgi:hypothetical protein